MSQLLEAVRSLGVAVLDPWCVIDAEDRIVEHSPSFRELFSRGVARGLVGMSCREALKVSVAEDGALKKAAADGPVRLHEQALEIEGRALRAIVGVAPIALAEGAGTLLFLRDVTDEARLQASYQQLDDQARRTREELEQELDERTRDLLTANDLINRLEQELARYKRGEI